MYKCETSFAAWGKLELLNSDEVIQGLFQRLPYRIKTQFVSVSRKGSDKCLFQSLRELVENTASDAETPLGRLMQKKPVKSGASPARGMSFRVCAGQRQTNAPSPCFVCKGLHDLFKCPIFLSKLPVERKRVVWEHRLCYNCLRKGHKVTDCKMKASCKDCGKRHHNLLHAKASQEADEASSSASSSSESQSKGPEKVVSASAGINNSKGLVDSTRRTILKVVPVKAWLNDPAEHVCTYAFIDEGLSVSLCSRDLANRLGVPIIQSNVELHTNNAVTTVNSMVQRLAVKGIEEVSAFQINDALIMDEIVDVSSSIPSSDLIKSYSHLKDINFPQLENKRDELLLGSELHQAFQLQDIRLGTPGDPSGLRTFLGWTIYGTDNGNREISATPRVIVNFADVAESPEQSCNPLLDILSRDFQDLGLPETPYSSIEDKRATEILNKTVKKVGDHYFVGLLWKENNPHLPNNRDTALQRPQGMKKRFKANPQLLEKYKEKIQECVDCGYAMLVPQSNSAVKKRINYITHHCVSTAFKFRVVFDCSAKFQNKSLNDRLLVGPDLTCNLLGVLLRFKEHPIAVVGDIKAMFSQVFVDEADCDVFRFLWYPDNDLTCEPVDYRLQTHVFGAKSSPCCAAYPLRVTAHDNLTKASETTVRTVLKNVYVDDVCCSCKSADSAIDLTDQLSKLLKSGGFHLTKFLSNHQKVLSSIPQKDLAESVGLDRDCLPAQKALGVYWNASTDRLMVKVDVKRRPCTRRGLLSMIAQTYDPLGLIQPFILPAKQLLQEACKRSLRWDDDLSNLPGLGMHWEKWFLALPQLEKVSIKRGLTLPEKEIAGLELVHTFSDASISGYGVGVYVRVRYVDGVVKCCFLLGKARVAPIKFVSVPRLELTAAVLAAKVTNFVINELDIKFSKVFLWTDSTVVLRYINCTSVRFTTFVANRLEILHSLTNCEQWHYAPSKQNPADIASRAVWPDKIDTCDMCFYGPAFLCNDVGNWPNQPDFLRDVVFNELEVKNEHCFAQLKEPDDSLHRLFRRYSNFQILLRTVSWLLR